MEVPGAVPLSLAAGVVHLDEPEAVFDAMLTGWARQQKSRLLGDSTVAARLALVRRFTAFTGTYPWQWTAADVEDFTMSLMSGDGRLAPSTIRGHHMSLKLFCDYLLDGRYDWVSQCETRFDEIPSQVCHDFNTAAHLVEYEGRPERRPFSYAELQTLYDAIRGVLGDAVARSRGLAASELKGEKKSHLAVHGRTGQPCPVCGDLVREVSFADSSLQYCPTCPTGGTPLADRRMSRLLT